MVARGDSWDAKRTGIAAGRGSAQGAGIHESAATFTLIIPKGITSIKVLAFRGVMVQRPARAQAAGGSQSLQH